ncbi:MAG: zinc ABC transporter substrate-binding protein, partial [Chitinophagaceae bacterium]|nr:zinc ABC transporter substrate-binding protein [Rubrivivax sp.]
MTLTRRNSLCLAGATLVAFRPLALRAQRPAARVVASFSILADMAQELAPAGVQVSALVGPDSDAHVYQPSPADGKRLAHADLVLINGLGFEGWIERMVKVSGYRGTVAIATQGIQPRTGGHSDADPHVWQDLALARRYAANIGAAFGQRWPGQREEIARRSAAYVARIDQLDAQVRGWLAAVPRALRRVITSHDAFGYFGAAYGVDFLAPQGWNTHSEPSAAAVARLIRQIKKDGVRAIFIENISDPRLVERIAREGGVRIGGTLYSDALSKPGGPAATYLQLFEHNARSL